MIEKNNDAIPFDGFGNVVEMLKVSDEVFRDKIIRGIAAKDPALAKRIVAALQAELREYSSSDRFEDSRERLQQSQRAHHTKHYGN